MKPIIFLLFGFLLVTCSPVPAPIIETAAATLTVLAPSRTLPSSVTIAPTASQTPTASEMPTLTEFPTKSETPQATQTALPFPLTPLPTFDNAKAHPLPTRFQAVCPKKNPAVVMPKIEYSQWTGDFLAYINAGGDLNSFKGIKFSSGPSEIVDLTGDGIPEIFYEAFEVGMDIYGCKNGQYIKLASFTTSNYMKIGGISDLNQNGIPEVLIADSTNHSPLLFIYEWDGSEFRSLIENQYDPFDPSKAYDWVRGPYQIRDTNGDGLQEISLVDDEAGIGLWYGFVPFNQIITLGWDGKHYINMTPGNYLPPKYRFQAVEFGDREILYKNYKKALDFYQSAIVDTSLEPWTRERVMYLTFHLGATPGPDDPTPLPDPNEYDRIAAYATYRSMILHVYLDQMDVAKKEHERLLTTFLPASSGYPYAELGDKFWKAYHSSGKMADACQSAIQYATSHHAVLEPLWNVDTNGLENHKYTAYDICPFGENKK